MKWADIAPLVAAGAPTLGKMLGGAVGTAVAGPFGTGIGSLLGDQAGKLLAGALGVPPTPDDVHAALVDPDQTKVTAAVQAAEAEAVAQWQAMASMVASEADFAKTQVHETSEVIESELELGALATGRVRDWILFCQATWRPFAMFVWVATWPWQLFYAFYQTIEPARGAVLTNLSWWNATPAVLAGAYSIGRTIEKVKEVQGNIAGSAGSIVKTVVGKIKR